MRIGYILLAIWLVLTGLSALFAFTFQGMAVIMGVLALAAGIMLLVGDNIRGGTRGKGGWRLTGGVGMLLLAIFLILTGLIALTGIKIPSEGVIMGILALVAGVALAIGR